MKEIYENKIISAGEAASKIKSGDTVVLANACAEAEKVVDVMTQNYKDYNDVKIVSMITMGKSPYVRPEMKGHFKYVSFFAGAPTRCAIDDGTADYLPCYFHDIPKLFKNHYIPVDVAIIQVSLPDECGYCSFGVSVDYIKAAAECAKMVIAEINPNMPRTLGDSFINISDIDYIVEVSNPIIELKPSVIGDVEKTIGKFCESLIDDGSTLQLGIGAIPDAVLLFLKDKKDLGIHSEMISDGVVELVKAGVINGKKKTLFPGKIAATFLMGTRKLYDFVDDNPEVVMYPVDYINDPYVIAKNYKMVSINSCISIDLMGQITAETIGHRQYSGVGGQIDFIRGASMSKGGKAIIAIPSTAGRGKFSRIVPILENGSAVTTPRNEVEYVVTEYGIARLRGKTLKERGRELINIAHPKFRDYLIGEWEKRFNDKF